MKTLSRVFDRFSHWVAKASAHWSVFMVALMLVVLWLAGGPHYAWSDTYNLLINTVTTIVTFLLAFIILNSSARSEAAIQLKLDELLRATQDARNDLISSEDKDQVELEAEKQKLKTL